MILSLFKPLTFFLAALLALSPKTVPIGISSSLDANGSPTLHPTYSAAVKAAGGTPVTLPRVTSQAQADEIVSTLSGIVFSGGVDFDPKYFGEKILNGTVTIDPRRDSSDIFLGRAALKAGIPIMGICRGCQLINILKGGTLWQDLPSQHPSPILHKQKESSSIPTHNITVTKGTFLADIISGRSTVKVNSHHHQAIRDVGEGLRVSATAPDGIVEGIEGTGSQVVIGVQFHPEKLYEKDRTWKRFFKKFVKKCQKR